MKLRTLIKRALSARRVADTSLLSQARDLWRLRKCRGRIGVMEYYDYGLYDHSRYSERDQEAFVGWRGETPVNDYFNKIEWAVFSIDKVTFYSLLAGVNVPHPSIKMLFSPTGRHIVDVPTLGRREDIEEFLRKPEIYPLFAKPSHGNFGRGAFFLQRYDQDKDLVEMKNGDTVEVSRFVDDLETKLSGGYLFQEAFSPPACLREVCGDRASTVRLVVVIIDDKPEVLSAVWKIPTGSNIIDNFKHGRSGNLVSSVDVDTGNVVRIIGGSEAGGFATCDTHPDTGARLMPMTLPYWDKIKAVCCDASSLFPGLKLLHFDVALAADGPLLLEINHRGNLDLHQHASGKGFINETLERAFASQDAHNKKIRAIIEETLRDTAPGA